VPTTPPMHSSRVRDACEAGPGRHSAETRGRRGSSAAGNRSVALLTIDAIASSAGTRGGAGRRLGTRGRGPRDVRDRGGVLSNATTYATASVRGSGDRRLGTPGKPNRLQRLAAVAAARGRRRPAVPEGIDRLAGHRAAALPPHVGVPELPEGCRSGTTNGSASWPDGRGRCIGTCRRGRTPDRRAPEHRRRRRTSPTSESQTASLIAAAKRSSRSAAS
jgi:hypothetical protein